MASGRDKSKDGKHMAIAAAVFVVGCVVLAVARALGVVP